MSLPDFLVIGAYKSGTTALHHYLRAHPEIFVPAHKEPNFFAFAHGDDAGSRTNPARGKAITDRGAYEALFARRGDARVAGEVSPEYLTNPRAAEAIRSLVPDVRLVAVLRNPVERAYSDYLMYRRDGAEDEGDFLRALDRQEERQRRGDPTGYYVSTGFYAEQLERYRSAFPPEQLHVLLYDELRRDRQRSLRGIFAFLGVDPDVEPVEQPPANVSGLPSNRVHRLAFSARAHLARTLGPIVPERVKRAGDAILQRGLEQPPLPDEARRRLVETYRDDVRRLEVMLDRDLSDWLVCA